MAKARIISKLCLAVVLFTSIALFSSTAMAKTLASTVQMTVNIRRFCFAILLIRF